MRLLSVIWVLFGFCHTLLGQLNLTVDTTLLADKSVKCLSIGDHGGIIVTESSEIYLMDEESKLREITELFGDFDLQSITSTAYYNHSTIFFGSSVDSLLYYNGTSVIQKGSSINADCQNINSMKFYSSTLHFGSENGIYVLLPPYDSAYLSHEDREVGASLMSENRHSVMIRSGGTRYCNNEINNVKLWNSRPDGTYVTGVRTDESLVATEEFVDAVLVYYSSRFIWNNSSIIYASDQGIKSHNIYCNDQVHKLVTNTKGNDLLLLKPNYTYNIPDVLLAATDSGLFVIEDFYNINETRTNFIELIGQLQINQIFKRPDPCDQTLWLATEAGVKKVKLNLEDIEFVGTPPQYHVSEWCGNNTYGHRVYGVYSSGLDFQWLKDGELLEGEHESSLHNVQPGFYQQIISSCYVYDTLDIIRYEYKNDVSADVSQNGSSNFCENENVWLLRPKR